MQEQRFDPALAPGRFKIARAILSFANRMPDLATRVCGGLAYVIVGAEPGSADGTKVYDGADLDNWLIKYLGGDGPAWTPNYVKHGDKDVLVIVVEAPKWGDRAHTLRQAYDKAVAGTIYYRSGSVSRQANPDEIRLLEQRLLRGQRTPELDGLQVSYGIDPPDELDLTTKQRADWPRVAIALDLAPIQIDEWIDARRTAIRALHQQAIDAAGRAKGLKPYAPYSIDVATIEDHLVQCREVLLGASQRVLVEGGNSLVTMAVTNPSERILDHVELTLTPGVPFSAFEEGRVPKELASLPAAPKPPKTGIPTVDQFHAYGPWFEPPKTSALGLEDYRLPDQRLDVDKTSITLNLGQIRPEKTATSSRFHLLLHRHSVAQAVTIYWTLTSPSADGVQRGSLQMPVASPRRIVLSASAGLPDDTNA